MKQNILLFMFLGLLVSVSAQNAQNAEWKTYLDEYKIENITDAGDYLWLTDGKGAIKFHKQSETALYYGIDNLEISPDKYFTSIITSISCDDNGLPWVGARFTGVLKMNVDKEWILLPPANSEQLKNWGNVILLITGNNEVWATVAGLYAFPMMLVNYQGNAAETFMTNSPVISLAEDKDGNLWTGRLSGGFFQGYDHYESLVKYDGENWTTFNAPLELGPPPFGITNITFDQSGKIWMIGGFGVLDNYESRLIKFKDPEWQVYDLPAEANIRYLRSFALQDDSIIWLGTTKGLMRFSNSKWTIFDIENSQLPSNCINSVVVDNTGTKWLGTDAGLVAFNGMGADEGLVAPNSNGIPLSVSNDSRLTEEIELYPNPAKDFITLKISGELINPAVSLLNIKGCVMKSFSVDNNQQRLDVSHLPAGVYLVRIQSERNQIVKKLVKE